MAKRAKSKKPIEQYEHKGKKRMNNPPVGLVDAKTDAPEGKKTYAYDPHLDPQLQWAGKAERTSFEIPTVSLHVHERIDPRSILEAARKKNGSGDEQISLFSSPTENPPLREAIEFYKHAHNWSNRLIAGDNLLVMNSLLEKEALAGLVQMIYFDPPYGIKYGSNFQPFVNNRDVKDGKDEDLTAEPETVKAFRDTWELGLHSYLSYLRDRLLLARELLSESGSGPSLQLESRRKRPRPGGARQATGSLLDFVGDNISSDTFVILTPTLRCDSFQTCDVRHSSSH